jgi:hypothetical protein
LARPAEAILQAFCHFWIVISGSSFPGRHSHASVFALTLPAGVQLLAIAPLPHSLISPELAAVVGHEARAAWASALAGANDLQECSEKPPRDPESGTITG